MHASDGIQRLRQGNARFKNSIGEIQRRTGPEARRQALDGQFPRTAILACSDSRVPVEVVFDQGIGDLFVVRAAGHVAGAAQLGSLELAASVLGVRLFVVMGHSDCTAVKCAMTFFTSPYPHASAGLYSVLSAVRRTLPRDPVSLDVAARSHVLATVETLLESPVLGPLHRAGEISVTGALYHLETGGVTFLEATHPDARGRRPTDSGPTHIRRCDSMTRS